MSDNTVEAVASLLRGNPPCRVLWNGGEVVIPLIPGKKFIYVAIPSNVQYTFVASSGERYGPHTLHDQDNYWLSEGKSPGVRIFIWDWKNVPALRYE